VKDDEAASYSQRERSHRLLMWRLARGPIVLLLGWWTLSTVLRGVDWIFLDSVNLLLHEGGHFVLSWAPQSIYILGGTLGQLFFPVAFGVYFLRKRDDRFAAAACLWWLGENFRNIARYMADAGPEALPLTGEIHDWGFLSRHWGFLSSAQSMATGIRTLGSLAMLAGLGYLSWSLIQPTDEALDEDPT